MIDPLYALWTGFAVSVGAVLGSFGNVCIARWPEDRSVISPRSACPSCGASIAAYDNVPVLSWVVLRGRCRACGWSIPATYPLVEVLGACLGFLVFRRFVPDGLHLDVTHLAAWAFYLVFAGALAIGALVDVRHRILPDEVTVFAVPVGVLGCGVLDGLGLVDWLQPAFADSVLGALVGAAFFGSVAAVALLVYQREALGWGDVKLLAMIGSFLGFHPAIFAILLPASLTSAVTGILATAWLRRRVYQPFGPALAAWALVYLLYGQVLLPAWLPGLRHLGAPDLKILLPGWI